MTGVYVRLLVECNRNFHQSVVDGPQPLIVKHFVIPLSV